MPAARPRPRNPAAKPETTEEPKQGNATPKPRANPVQARSIGNQDTQSRVKAEVAAKRGLTVEQILG